MLRRPVSPLPPAPSPEIGGRGEERPADGDAQEPCFPPLPPQRGKGPGGWGHAADSPGDTHHDDPPRKRHHGHDRGRNGSLLGSADAALAPELRDRRDSLHAAHDPRVRHPEEGGRRGEPRAGPPPRGSREAHRGRGRRGHRRQAGRALSARRLPDRERHADQHERERGHRQSRDRARRRRDGLEGSGPSERRR